MKRLLLALKHCPRIPNWRTWPDQVFGCPAGFLIAWEGGYFIQEALSGAPFIARWAALMALFAVCFGAGMLISAALFYLRGPRTRLRSTRLTAIMACAALAAWSLLTSTLRRARARK